MNSRKTAVRKPDYNRTDSVKLSDGRSLWIRPIAKQDAEPIDAAFVLLHEDEIRRRFLHPVRALSQEHLRKLTHPLPRTEYVVVAAEPYPAGEALVGAVARLSVDTDTSRAEFGILVSHFLAHRGVGIMLMHRLTEFCKAEKVKTLWGDVADDNTAMLQLADKLGFKHFTRLGEPGIVRIELDIR
jgi:RimJ/RimL family protein N-acetyltransferase